jgi:hypothetical protein
MKINWLKKIVNQEAHNAFVDLCEFKQQLFCCFREAQTHISAGGKIRILTLDKQGIIQGSNRITLPNTDLRDPKLSILPDGSLLLIAYARKTDPNNQSISTRNLSWVSQTGHSWSSCREFADKGWWLWRVRWHQGLAYGFAYNRRQNAIHFYSGHPRRTFHRHQEYALSLEKHNKGYPNESDLIFTDEKAYALVRRDADSYSAQLGQSSFPYKKWSWTDLGEYIGGPVMLQIKPNVALVAGRIMHNKRLVTGLMTLNLSNGKLCIQMILPSAGDNSYPGLVLNNHTLYISYYSSHEDKKSCIYLAKLNIASVLD